VSAESAVLLYSGGVPIWSKSEALSPLAASALSDEIADGIAYFSKAGGSDDPPPDSPNGPLTVGTVPMPLSNNVVAIDPIAEPVPPALDGVLSAGTPAPVGMPDSPNTLPPV
jgi:hypothetical protein